MAGDAATKAAASVRPSEADLAQVDRPADDNTWHDAPDFSKGNLKKQVQGVYKGSANNKNSNNDAGAALTNGSQAGQVRSLRSRLPGLWVSWLSSTN